MNPSRAVTFFANVAPSLMPFTVFQSALTMEGLGFCSAKASFRASMEPDAVSRFEAESSSRESSRAGKMPSSSSLPMLFVWLIVVDALSVVGLGLLCWHFQTLVFVYISALLYLGFRV